MKQPPALFTTLFARILEPRMDTETRPHWSFDRRVNIGHILTTVSALALAVSWGVSVETRLAEQTIHLQSASAWAQETSRQLGELNGKVQQLIELTAYQKGLDDGRHSGR